MYCIFDRLVPAQIFALRSVYLQHIKLLDIKVAFFFTKHHLYLSGDVGIEIHHKLSG